MQVQSREQGLVLERIGCALVVGVFLVSLVSRAISWDWIMDTIFLGVAAALVIHGLNAAAEAERRSRWPLMLCGYLFVDSVFLFLVDLRSFAAFTLFYLLLSALYGRALQLRLRSSDAAAHASLSSTVFAPAVRNVSVLSLVALFCMALPMTQVAWGFSAWSGPMVVSFHNVTTMNAGHTVHFGGAVARYGYQLTLGHPVCLLLIAVILLPFLHSAGLVRIGKADRLLRVAMIAVLLWWVFFARGFQSLLGYPATLVFVAATVAVTVLLFRRPAALPA